MHFVGLEQETGETDFLAMVLQTWTKQDASQDAHWATSRPLVNDGEEWAVIHQKGEAGECDSKQEAKLMQRTCER